MDLVLAGTGVGVLGEVVQLRHTYRAEVYVDDHGRNSIANVGQETRRLLAAAGCTFRGSMTDQG